VAKPELALRHGSGKSTHQQDAILEGLREEERVEDLEGEEWLFGT